MLRISFLSLALTSILCQAQITITSSHMPKANDKIEYSVASPIGIDVSKTGTNVSWDYSDLTSISDGIEEYKPSYTTPYIINFGFTAIGLKLRDTLGFSSFQLKNIYNFYQNSSGSYKDVGIGFQFSAIPIPQSGKHTDPDEIFVFPLQYGDKDSTTFDVEVPISAGIKLGSFFRKGNRVTTVDGWGTITTPYGKDIPCIRVKSVIEEMDSIKVTSPSLNFSRRSTRVEYKWLSTSEKIPVLMVTGIQVQGQFSPSNVQYRNDRSKAEPITVDFSADKTSPKVGDVIQMTNQSIGNSLTYNWTLSPTTGFIFVNGTSNTSENPTLVFQDTGYYSVTLTANDGSNSESETKTNYIHVRSKNSSIEKLFVDFNVYPNPTQGDISVNYPSTLKNAQISITNTCGEVCYEKEIEEGGRTEIKNLAPGLYQITLKSEGSYTTKRIMVN